MTENKRYYIGNGENCTICDSNEGGSDFYNMLTQFEAVDRLNEQEERIQKLETDVEYWKQVASQYSNELNVFEHCKKYKTECKDIYWDSD